AATGAVVGSCVGRPARSISRLYSASVSVTARGVSLGRGGCCADAACAVIVRIAASQGALPHDIRAEPRGWLAVSLGALRAPWTAMRVTRRTGSTQRAASRSSVIVLDVMADL